MHTMDAGSQSSSSENAVPSMAPADVIESLKSKSVTLGKENGFFVSAKNMNKAEKSLVRMATTESTPAIVAEAERALAHMTTLKTGVKVAEDKLKAAQIERDEASAAHTKTLAELEKLRGDGPDSLPTMQRIAKEYKVQLDTLSKELGKAKVQAKSAEKGFDPELAEATQKHENDLRAQLNTFQKERKAMDKKLDAAKVAVETQSNLAVERLASLKAANEQLSTLKSKKALSMKNGPLPALDISIRTPVVRAIVGEKGLEWMNKIDLQVRENMRDYAHNLMQAANSSNTTRGLGDLLHYVWTWMKTKSYAVRETLRPWVESIHRDLANGTVQAVKVYRQSLEAVVEEFKVQKANTEKKYKGKKGWSINTLAALKTVVKGASSFRMKLQKAFSNTYKYVKGVFGKVLGMMPLMKKRGTNTTAEDAALFDADAHIKTQDLDPKVDSESDSGDD